MIFVTYKIIIIGLYVLMQKKSIIHTVTLTFDRLSRSSISRKMLLPPMEERGVPSELSKDLVVVLARNGLPEMEVVGPENVADRVKSN